MDAAQLTAQAVVCLVALLQHHVAEASDISPDLFPLAPGKLALPPPPPPRHPSCDQHIDFASHFHGFAQTHRVHDHEARSWYLSSQRQPLIPLATKPAKPHAFVRFRTPFSADTAAFLVSPLFKAKPFSAAAESADLGGCRVEFEFAARSATLRVSVHEGNASADAIELLFGRHRVVWSSNGTNTGTAWHRGFAELSEPLHQPFTIVLDGECGVGGEAATCTPFSVVAVSSLQLSPGCGGCLTEDYDPPKCSSSVSTFDNGLDGFQQSSTDDVDWTRHFGPTMSLHSGPRQDHTSGKGAYMYVESRNGNYGGTAVLTSPEWTLSNSAPLCTLSFWYLMNGVHMGILTVRVSVSADASKDRVLFNKEGVQGKSWLQATIALPNFGGDTIRVSFIANLALSSTSDIAIDDVSLSSGCCPPPTAAPPRTAVAAVATVASGAVSSDAAADVPTPDSLLGSDMTADGGSVTPTVGKGKRNGISKKAMIIGITLPVVVLLLIVIIFIVVKVIVSKRAKHTEPQHYQHRDEESTGEGDVATNTAAEM